MYDKDLEKYVEDDTETYTILDKTPEECDEIIEEERKRLKKLYD